MQGLGDILHQQQIKQLIQKLTQFEISQYASPAWFKQDENLQKLNMQLHVNALMKNDQYILEQCIAEDKFKMLIYDLIMTATWKEKVLTLIKPNSREYNSLKLYLSLYHECVVANILEVLMFHRTAVEQSGEYLIELIDYCYTKIMKQVANSIKKRKENSKSKDNKEQTMSKILKRTPEQQTQAQIQQIQFSLFIMSISMLRYVTDYVKYLEIGIVHHLLVQCNIYTLLVPLIEERPWMRVNNKEEREIFQNNKWHVVPKSQYGKLPKTQAQVWIALYNLFMDPECRKKYQINDQRKNTLLKLRKYLNEVLLDQIPALAHMLRSLEELSMMNVPTHLSSNPFVVQQMPIIASAISKGRDWKELAEKHAIRLKQSMDETERQQIQRLAELYTNNTVQGLIQGFKCKKCEKQAFKRCSKCKNAWYCSRECQVADWPDHKVACNKLVKQQKQAEEKKKSTEIPVVPKKQLIDQLD